MSLRDSVADIKERTQALLSMPRPQGWTMQKYLDLAHRLHLGLMGDCVELANSSTVRDRPPNCLGCSSNACCRMFVAASLVDAMILVDHLHCSGRLSPGLLRRLYQRHSEQEGMTELEWIKQDKMCLLLRESRCSVYDYRPVACAWFWVVEGGPDDCASGRKVMSIDPGLEAFKLGAGTTALQHLMGLDGPPMGSTLPGAVWAVGEAWPFRDDLRRFRRKLERNWPQIHVSSTSNSPLGEDILNSIFEQEVDR